ncbi:hypothetical protein TCON_1902 [Astathelohania contejeani]|uniref:Uncharacterized protein n=1 Tax=Astathelohania contejeani TaxID=164912 RepID=A0ABQ7HXI5_9MICR|nr:hypothetical protein TCON_1902 [Thelohania contejeani]
MNIKRISAIIISAIMLLTTVLFIIPYNMVKSKEESILNQIAKVKPISSIENNTMINDNVVCINIINDVVKHEDNIWKIYDKSIKWVEKIHSDLAYSINSQTKYENEDYIRELENTITSLKNKKHTTSLHDYIFESQMLTDKIKSLIDRFENQLINLKNNFLNDKKEMLGHVNASHRTYRKIDRFDKAIRLISSKIQNGHEIKRSLTSDDKK